VIVFGVQMNLYMNVLFISQSKQYIEFNTVIKTNNRKKEVLKRKKKKEKFVIFYFNTF
jgi:hypothetical protein